MYLMHEHQNYLLYENLSYILYPKELADWANSQDELLHLTVKEAAVILRNLKHIGLKIGLASDGGLVAVSPYEYRMFTFEKMIVHILKRIDKTLYGIEVEATDRKYHRNIEILTRILNRTGTHKQIPLEKMTLKEICELLYALPDGYQYDNFFCTPILHVNTDRKIITISYDENKDYSITCY